MLTREPTTIPFSTEAMKANLLRLQNEWEKVQASRDRGAIYQYLTAVFELVTCVGAGGQGSRVVLVGHCTCEGTSSIRKPEPFAAVILCTSDPGKVDYPDTKQVVAGAAVRRSKQGPGLAAGDFIKRRGGINACARRFARRLGRGQHRGATRTSRELDSKAVVLPTELLPQPWWKPVFWVCEQKISFRGGH